MEEKINRLLLQPLYPYLYGAAFITFKSAQYFPSFSWQTAAFYFFIFSVGSFLIKRLFDRIFHSGYTGIGIVALWASILHVAGIAQLLRYNYSYIRFAFMLCYIFLRPALYW